MAKLVDEAVSELIENHRFSGTTDARIDYMGRQVPPVDWEAFGWDAWEDHGQDEPILVEGLGLVNVIETFGGEGQGDDYYMIFRVITEEGATHYKLDGRYASYYGGEYYGPLEKVTAHEEVITVWR